MAARRRTQFKGVDPLAVRELVGIQADLSGDTDQLRSDALGNTTDTKTASGYHAGYNQRVRVKMPAGGGTLSFPPANSASQNKWIEVIHTGGGNVTIVPTGNFVQGAGTFALTAPGSYYFQSDGLNSWWVQPTGGGGLSAPVTNAQLDVMPANTVKVNATAGAATPTDLAIAVSGVLGRGAAGNIQSLTPTLLTGNVLQFTAAASGKVPLSGGGTVNFLRADGAWAAPPAGGSVPTGTGFTHITAGAQDAAAKLVDTADINALQVTNAKLAARTANSLMGEFTGAAVAPQDLAVAVQSAVFRAAANITTGACAADQCLQRLGSADLGFGNTPRLMRAPQVLTATNAAFAHPTGTRFIIVEMVGGAGAGGGTAAVAGACGNGGNAANWGRKTFTSISGTSNITIGAGGTGVSGAAGNNGGNSSMVHNAVTFTVPGGIGGAVLTGAATLARAAANAGNAANTGADVSIVGQPGERAYRPTVAAALASSGNGGSSPFGNGGFGNRFGANGIGEAGSGFGAGGAGAAGPTSLAQAGAAGTQGVAIVWEFG